MSSAKFLRSLACCLVVTTIMWPLRALTSCKLLAVFSNNVGLAAKVKQVYSNKDIDELGGLTVNLVNGSWFNLRPSNTEPLLRLNAEARTKNEINNIVGAVEKLIA